MGLLFIFCLTFFGQAFEHNAISGGIGYFSENSLGKITKDDSGKESLSGTVSFPLLLRYDYSFLQAVMGQSYFVSPRLGYTLLPREDSGNTVKVTTLSLFLPVGLNLGTSAWDLSFGPGLLRRTLDGEGGVTVLNNGSGTNTFAVPGRKVTTQTVALDFATSYTYGRHRFAVDLMNEGSFSDKRTWNFMLSYLFQFNSPTAVRSSMRKSGVRR